MQEPIDGQPPEPLKEQPKAAMMITIQSWMTPVIGIVALILGLFGGYLLRPLISGNATIASDQNATSTQVAQVTNPPQTEGGGDVSVSPSGTSTPSLMEYLMSQARHVKGNPEASVTIIEFSDYQ